QRLQDEVPPCAHRMASPRAPVIEFVALTAVPATLTGPTKQPVDRIPFLRERLGVGEPQVHGSSFLRSRSRARCPGARRDRWRRQCASLPSDTRWSFPL